MSNTIANRQNKEKIHVIQELKKTPIVQVACERAYISRATYYRWRNEDVNFASQADEALFEGCLLVNDLAESKLMSAIKDKNLTAIIFWLKHHHAKYTTRVEVTARLKNQNETLTPEQEALVTKALELASIVKNE